MMFMFGSYYIHMQKCICFCKKKHFMDRINSNNGTTSFMFKLNKDDRQSELVKPHIVWGLTI